MNDGSVNMLQLAKSIESAMLEHGVHMTGSLQVQIERPFFETVDAAGAYRRKRPFVLTITAQAYSIGDVYSDPMCGRGDVIIDLLAGAVGESR